MNSIQEYAINEIMENFDFEEVHKTMTLLNWEWGLRLHAPTLSEIKEKAQRLLISVANNPNKDCWSACGGFRVEKFDDNYLLLLFVVTGWDNFDDSETDELVKKKYKKAIEEASSRYNSPFACLEI